VENESNQGNDNNNEDNFEDMINILFQRHIPPVTQETIYPDLNPFDSNPNPNPNQIYSNPDTLQFNFDSDDDYNALYDENTDVNDANYDNMLKTPGRFNEILSDLMQITQGIENDNDNKQNELEFTEIEPIDSNIKPTTETSNETNDREGKGIEYDYPDLVSVLNPKLDRILSESKAFVTKDLEEFKSIGDQTNLLISHLSSFKYFIANIKRLNFITNLEHYGKNGYYGAKFTNDYDITVFDLIHVMEWIDYRIEYVSIPFIKQELLYIKQDLRISVDFIESLGKSIFNANRHDSGEFFSCDLKQNILRETTARTWSEEVRARYRIQIVSYRIYHLLNFLKFMDYASYKINENLEAKGKEKIIDYKLPAINKEVKRQGKAFVSKGLQEFKELSSSENLRELAPHFEVLKNYVYDINTKTIKQKVKDILNNFDKITKNRSSRILYTQFNMALESYKDCYESVYKLDYAIEWIGKRIDYISNEKVKEELTSIQQGLIESKRFHDSAQNIVSQLIQVTKVLEQNGMTPEVARDLVTLIIQLKELSLENDSRQGTLSIWSKVLGFYRNFYNNIREFNVSI